MSTSTKGEKKRNRRSQVYEYFDISDEKKPEATCRQCNEVVIRGETKGSFNTTNLWRHIEKCSNVKLDYDELSRPGDRDLPQLPSDALGNTVNKPPAPKINVPPDSTESRQVQALSSPLTAFSLSEKQSLGASKRSNSPSSRKIVNSSLRKKWPAHSPKSQEITNAINLMIARDFQPFSIVEDRGFVNLLHILAPNYEIPSRKTFSKHLIPILYNKKRELLKESIDAHLDIGSFTSDLWTSINGDSFISFTIHFLNDAFERLNYMLETLSFELNHTAENISDKITKILSSWNIERQKVFSIAHDNAANVKAGVRATGFESVCCVNHTLQLIINDALEENDEIKALIKKISSVVGHFNRSHVSRNLYSDYQRSNNIPQAKLIQDVDVRWNSTYYMIKRFCEQQQTIKNVAIKIDTMLNLPTDQEWSVIRKLVDILEPFEDATKEFEKNSAFLSEVIPLTLTLQNFLKEELEQRQEELIESFLDKLNEGLKARLWEKIISSNIYIIATLLDPRFKYDPLKKFVKLEEAEEVLLVAMSEIKNERSDHGSRELSLTQNQLKRVKLSVWSKYAEIKDSDRTSNKTFSPSSLCSDELRKYLREECRPTSEDPLLFWRQYQVTYPTLSKVARKYFSALPGSSISERVFSIAGNIVTKKRNKLNPEKVNMLVFLHSNLNKKE